MNVEIGTEAAQFPENEYINGISVAMQKLRLYLGLDYVLYSTLLPQCWRTLGLNAGLLRLWHWQSDAPNHSAISHPLVIN
jgi:hypothetical protein